MNTTDDAVEVLCHCVSTHASGHLPGADGCAAGELKRSAVRPFNQGPRPGSAGASVLDTHNRMRANRAAGTCPVCGALRRVDRVKVYGLLPIKGAEPNRVPLAIEPRVAEHRVKGQAEPCPGGIPVETTYRLKAGVLSGWTAQYGPDSIVRSTK